MGPFHGFRISALFPFHYSRASGTLANTRKFGTPHPPSHFWPKNGVNPYFKSIMLGKKNRILVKYQKIWTKISVECRKFSVLTGYRKFFETRSEPLIEIRPDSHLPKKLKKKSDGFPRMGNQNQLVLNPKFRIRTPKFFTVFNRNPRPKFSSIHKNRWSSEIDR